MPHEPMTDNTKQAQGSGAHSTAVGDLQRANAAADLTVPEDGNYPGGISHNWLWLTARDCALAALSQPPKASEVEAVAWLHTLHMEGGQTRSRLLEWDGVDEDKPERNGFGVPGRDYSACYPVTVTPLYAHPPKASPMQDDPTFKRGDRVEKISGAKWRGTVVGEYSTALTPEGYAVESETETGSVQIYPVKALSLALAQPAPEQGEGFPA